MGQPNRATHEKRRRERAQKDRQVQKEESRLTRKDTRAERAASVEAGVDPDLIGIFPGPQPVLEEEF